MLPPLVRAGLKLLGRLGRAYFFFWVVVFLVGLSGQVPALLVTASGHSVEAKIVLDLVGQFVVGLGLYLFLAWGAVELRNAWGRRRALRPATPSPPVWIEPAAGE